MLFNSYPFLFVFLPIALAGFALAGGEAARCLWLAAVSLAFYALAGTWTGDAAVAVSVLVVSISVNFLLGHVLARRRWLLGAGVAGNLLVLGFFRYGGALGLASADMPPGISFFTFTQIGWLVDMSCGRAECRRGWRGALDYLLFVSWFPHLIAGPLLHHGQTTTQFHGPGFRITAAGLAVGSSAFLAGLFKKTVLADGLAPLADAGFAAASGIGVSGLGAAGAWGAVLAYTLQIYFDFSGYSDMAIGLSRMFGVVLPVNFDSPYRAGSVVAFWRRWHMSLSAFLRERVYVPLGGRERRAFSLMATMLLAGMWHGAGWGFVAWGAWHGALLVVAHAWRWQVPRRLGWAGTMLAVMLGWVLFRAPDLAAAGAMYGAMAGLHGWGGAPGWGDCVKLLAGGAVVLALPNTRQWLAGSTATGGWPRWRPEPWWVVACFALLAVSLMRMGEASPFLYARF